MRRRHYNIVHLKRDLLDLSSPFLGCNTADLDPAAGS